MCRNYQTAHGTQLIFLRSMQEYHHSRSQFANAPHSPHSNALLAIHRFNIMISLRIIFFMAPPARKKGFAKLVVCFQTKKVRFAQYRRAVARQYWLFPYWKQTTVPNKKTLFSGRCSLPVTDLFISKKKSKKKKYLLHRFGLFVRIFKKKLQV